MLARVSLESVHSRRQTVRIGATLVNTLVTPMRTKDGQRLEAFVREHWTGDGGMRGLCAAAGIAPETLYRWFRGETEPDLGSIRQLAAALEVGRAEIVAAIDGQLPPPNWRSDLDGAMREFVASLQAAELMPPPPNPPQTRQLGRSRPGQRKAAG